MAINHCNVVEGFWEGECLELLDFRKKMRAEIDRLWQENREEILASPTPLDTILKITSERFCNIFELEGTENIPAEGNLIIAPNHPFGITDIGTLILKLKESILRKRSSALVGNISVFEANFGDLTTTPQFRKAIIPVKTESGSFGKPVNGKEVIDAAITYLKQMIDGLLFIAPEGGTAAYQNRIAPPFRGFATVAREAQARICPVLFTGNADTDKLIFQIRAQILPSYQPAETDEETARIWTEIMQETLLRTSVR